MTPVATGALAWRAERLDLYPGEDPWPGLARLLPPATARRDTLARFVVGGRTGLAGEAALERALAGIVHDFAWLEVDRAGLAVDHAPDDLDAIDAPGGALRAAAEALRAEADDEDRTGDERQAALAALSRLYAYAGEVA